MTRRSDSEMERLLEDWLDDEARPMPPQVLESSLEAVTRTNQVGGSAFSRRWRPSPIFASAMAVAAVVLIVAFGPTIADNVGGWLAEPSESPGVLLVWDPSTDFLNAPDQQNPTPDQYGNGGVWSYLRSRTNEHDPANYQLLPNFDPARDAWYERDLVNTLVSQDGYAMALHGWSDGNPANNHFAILGWTSPVTGSVTILGGLWSGQPNCPEPADGISFSLDRGAETLEVRRIPNGGSSNLRLTVYVEEGQTLYFINDPGSDARCDTLFLRLTLTAHE